MSLLLEALKKAEKAKEEAARRTGSASSGELQLADDDRPPPAADDKPVMTRNELPDITRPMEISSEDFATPTRESEASRDPRHSAAQGKDGPEDSAPATRKPAPARPKSTATVNPEERAAAKNVFEAKFKEPNPKLPFYITMALLGAFALGTVVYFWYQLRPPPALVNPNPPKPPGEPVAAAPPQASASDAKPPAAAQESVAPQVPGLASKPVAASTTSTSPSAPAATTGPATTSVLAAAKPAAGTPPLAPATVAPRRGGGATGDARTQAAARAPADPSKVSVSRPAMQVNPRLEAAWRAYNEGNLPAARAAYEDALREEPANRDALLGMAAVEVRSRRLERAEALYQRLLDADPRDAHAQAGLLALRGQMVEPVQIESRVKSLLANDPDSHVLHFTLGNQYSQQGRWAEAQQSYFKAYSADPENADFAYNLAVSLDQLRQRKLALEYYRRALALAQQRSGSFDQSLARNRVQELSR